MARSPSGLPAFGQGPTSNQGDSSSPQGLRLSDDSGTPNDPAPVEIQGWLDEGLSVRNAYVVDDVARALAACRGIPDAKLDNLVDTVVHWALVAQGRAVAA